MVSVATSLGIREHSGDDFDFLAGSMDAASDMVEQGFSRGIKNQRVTYSKGALCVVLKTCYVEENLYWLLEDCKYPRRTWLVAAGSNGLPELG